MKWATAALGEVCEVVSGATPKTGNPTFWDGDVPWVTPKDLSDNGQKYLTDTPRKITQEGLKSCSAKMLPPESVLFSSRAPIGLIAINRIPVCTNQGFKSMVPRDGILSPDYLYWWLDIHREDVQRLGRGATFKEVSKKIVEGIQIPLPPLAEQKRIAAILDAADGLRAKRRESLAQLDTLLQSTFLDMFGDPVINPKGWEIQPLRKICELLNGYMFKSSDYVESSNTLSCRMGNIRPGGFFDLSHNPRYLPDDFGEQFARYLLKDGDVVIAMTDLADAPKILGVPTVVRTEGKRVLLNQRVGKLKIIDEANIHFEYFKAALNAPTTRTIYKKFAGGGLQINLGKNDLLSVTIPIPPIDLQRRFATIVESVEQQKARLRQHLAELDTLFASLQQRAFNGEL